MELTRFSKKHMYKNSTRSIAFLFDSPTKHQWFVPFVVSLCLIILEDETPPVASSHNQTQPSPVSPQAVSPCGGYLAVANAMTVTVRIWPRYGLSCRFCHRNPYIFFRWELVKPWVCSWEATINAGFIYKETRQKSSKNHLHIGWFHSTAPTNHVFFSGGLDLDGNLWSSTMSSALFYRNQ